MNRINFLLCLLVLNVFVVSARQPDTAALNKIGREVQLKYAPDKRSVYFNLTTRRDSTFLESTSQEAVSEMLARVKALPDLKLKAVILPALLNGMEYGVANLSVSNNRSAPQNAAEMVTQMIMGTPVEILKKQGGYYLVRTPDGYLSWTDGTAVGVMNQADFLAWKNAPKIVFTADYGHAVIAPEENAQRISDLVSGNILQLLGTYKKFFKVMFPDKREGYISRSQAVEYSAWLKRPAPTAEKLTTTAKNLLGAPYLWGGTSVKGMDCSGFTKTAYFLNGIIIPRDASQQALVGTIVDVMEHDTVSIAKCLQNLLPGDLLFFSAAKRRGISGGRVTHTAMYIGNGEFIQAAGIVKVSSLRPEDSNYDEGQVRTMVGARRMLNAIGKPEITLVANHPWYVSLK